MLNRKYFPFERNSYYFGKLLTARDFEAEQRYLNDKRRFVNRLTGANGIVAGLGVIMADDASIIIQAGCAFDASGREIIVPETRVVKLSTIEGYAQLTGSSAYLGIHYDEQPTDEVYSVMSDDDGGVRHNKVREQYKLTLLDEALVAKIPREMDEFVSRLVIYADQEVEVSQLTPRYLPRRGSIAIRVQIARLGAGIGEYSFAYALKTPGFKNEEGQPETHVTQNNIKLAQGESAAQEILLYPEEYARSTGVTLAVDGFVIRRNDESFSLNQRLESNVQPVEQELTDFYLTTCYGRSMDKTLGETYDERLWIAQIGLIRQNAAVIIDRVSPPPFSQYSYNAQQLMMLRRLEEFYPAERTAIGAPISTASTVMQSVATESSDSARYTASGVFSMPLGMGYAPKESIFSEEIMHGLGKGPVYVDVGIEYITADEREGSSSEIILGDISVFKQDRHPAGEERIYDLSTAVKILPERGTFVVGICLGDSTGLISLRIRWFAMKLGEVSKQIKTRQEGERMILVNPDTIVLQPKATAHLSPVFINMPNEACVYRLVDAEGGSIDNSGVYTAPAKEGVYEIRIEALSDSTVFTHVFAIVTQKKKE